MEFLSLLGGAGWGVSKGPGSRRIQMSNINPNVNSKGCLLAHGTEKYRVLTSGGVSS